MGQTGWPDKTIETLEEYWVGLRNKTQRQSLVSVRFRGAQPNLR
jgi:hypothetical protein